MKSCYNCGTFRSKGYKAHKIGSHTVLLCPECKRAFDRRDKKIENLWRKV